MAGASFVDEVIFVASAGGTAAFTVSAAVQGYRTPAQGGAVNGKTYRYRAESADKSQWEYGDTVASGGATSFTRTVRGSSVGGTTTVDFTSPPNVMLTFLSIDMTPIDSNTLMLFQQTTAPTGWTKQTTHNDKALRVVSGNASSGGTNAFSTVMGQTAVGNTTISGSTMPSHTHGVGNQGGAVGGPGGGCLNDYATVGGGNTGAAGSGNSHNHTITLSIQFVDLIIAAKD